MKYAFSPLSSLRVQSTLPTSGHRSGLDLIFKQFRSNFRLDLDPIAAYLRLTSDVRLSDLITTVVLDTLEIFHAYRNSTRFPENKIGPFKKFILMRQSTLTHHVIMEENYKMKKKDEPGICW